MISAEATKSGVLGNLHAPFGNRGQNSDVLLDYNPPEEELPFVRRESRSNRVKLDTDEEFPSKDELPF